MCTASFTAATFVTATYLTSLNCLPQETGARTQECHVAVRQWGLGAGGIHGIHMERSLSRKGRARVCPGCQLPGKLPEQGHASTQTNADICGNTDKTERVRKVLDFPKRQLIF